MPLTITQNGNIVEVGSFVTGGGVTEAVDKILLHQIDSSGAVQWIVAGSKTDPDVEPSIDNTDFNFDLQFFYDPLTMRAEDFQVLSNAERFTSQTCIGLVQVVCYSINGQWCSFLRPDYDWHIYDDGLANIDIPDEPDFPYGCYINTVSQNDNDENNAIPFYAFNELLNNPNLDLEEVLEYPQTYGGVVLRDAAGRGGDHYCCATITQSLTLHPKFRTKDNDYLRILALDGMLKACQAAPTGRYELPGFCLTDATPIMVVEKPKIEFDYKVDDVVERISTFQSICDESPQLDIELCILFANIFIDDYVIVYRDVVENIGHIVLITAIRRPASEDEKAWKTDSREILKNGEEILEWSPDTYDPQSAETQDYLIWTDGCKCWISEVNNVEEHIQRQYVDSLVAYSCAPDMTPNAAPTMYQYSIYTYPVAMCYETKEYHVLHDGVFTDVTKLHDLESKNLTNVKIVCQPAALEHYEVTKRYISLFITR